MAGRKVTSNPVGRFHPRDVVLHLNSLRSPSASAPWRRTAAPDSPRAQHELIPLLEPAHPLQELRRVWIIALATSAPLNFAPDSICQTASGFISSRCCLEQRPEDVPGHPHANVEEDLVRSAQIRASFLDDTAEIPRRSFACTSKARRTRRSSGSPPRSGHQATRTPLRFRSRVLANMEGSEG